ncbi:bro3 [Dasineura jujubifolia toursvirus 2a]|nr:bro3 [Dasineura jujubifolia toursvirus 2a]
MDQIIAQLSNTSITEGTTEGITDEVQAPLRLDLDESFMTNFNNIFKFNEKPIKVAGTVNDPWFRSKDILGILEYNLENRNSIYRALKKVDKEYLKHMNEVSTLAVDTSSYNEGKEVYVNEPGLYQLIMGSKLETAKPFKKFVFSELLPGIRKIIQKRYEDQLKNKQDQLEIVITQNKTLIGQNNNLLSEVSEVRTQNNNLLNQNTLALKRLEEMGITLGETKEQLDEIQEELQDTNTKLDKALPDRNIDPKNKDLKHHYILMKLKDDENSYMFIRGQDRHIKNKVNQYSDLYEITIDQTKTPNPIDLVNRLKQRIQDINEEHIKDNKILKLVKSSDEYLQGNATVKRLLVTRIKKEHSLIEYKLNKIFLKNYNNELFLDLIKELENEKYDIIV